MKTTYVLITAARNEEAYIEKTIKSVINQTIIPKKWIIVNDGSTDRTDEIVRKYETKMDFIQLLQMESGLKRDFASKVYAIRKGIDQLKGLEYEFLGILDADLSFEPKYYESIISKFHQNQRLGIAGAILFDVCGSKIVKRLGRLGDVSGATQMFRRKCFEEIGGLKPLKRGAEDTVACVMARIHGWEVRSFPEINGLHHRATGTAKENFLMARFNFGIRDYSYGSHPLFEVFKCIRRVAIHPYLIGSIMRMAGFIWAYCRKEKRLVTNDFIKHIRREHMQRLRSQLFEKPRFMD